MTEIESYVREEDKQEYRILYPPHPPFRSAGSQGDMALHRRGWAYRHPKIRPNLVNTGRLPE